MNKPSKAILISKYVLMGGNSPFLLGTVGIGKSSVVRTLAEDLADGRTIVDDEVNPKKNEFGFIDFRLSLYESHDLSGLPFIDGEKQRRAFLGNLPESGDGVLFLDEYSQCHPTLMAVAGQLLYELKIGEYHLPKGWQIIVAGNRSTDRAGSNKLTSNVVSRVTNVSVVSDTNDWLSWAVKNDVHPDILGFISFMPDYLNDFDPKVVTPQPCPRSWVRLSDTLKTDPPEDIIQAIADGDVGETASIEFMSFRSLAKDVLPSIPKILKGEDVDIPDSMGLQYATCVSLMSAIKQCKENVLDDWFSNAVDWTEKLPTPEFGIFFVKSMVGSRPDVVESARYGEFKIKHQDLEV